MKKNCPKCGIEHEKGGTFCSRKCANSRTWNKETNEKRSISAKKWRNDNIPKSPETKCVICDKIHFNKNRKTCSEKCLKEIRQVNGKKATGGYRENSGNSKPGYFKGIYCSSTYELVWIIYRLDNNLPVNRFKGYIQGNGFKYFPDFIIDNTIIEIKGHYNNLVNEKCELARSNGYEIVVKYKKDLKDEFAWAKSNYTYKCLSELYDNYKPKYEYICDHCGLNFSSNTKRDSKGIFCSRSCCGKGSVFRRTGYYVP